MIEIKTNNTFDAKTATNKTIAWIRDWFDKNGKDQIGRAHV